MHRRTCLQHVRSDVRKDDLMGRGAESKDVAQRRAFASIALFWKPYKLRLSRVPVVPEIKVGGAPIRDPQPYCSLRLTGCAQCRQVESKYQEEGRLETWARLRKEVFVGRAL